MNRSEGVESNSLTPDQEHRLIAEEIFRLKVREHLMSTDKTRASNTLVSKLWAFMNSTFGIFFFGTIVVGLATWAAGVYEKQSRITSEQAALIQKLDAEISFRIMPLSSLFANGSIDHGVQAELASVVFSADPPSRHNFMVIQARNLYPEFGDRNLVSLFVQLRYLAPDARRSALRESAEQAVHMERLLKSSPRKQIHLAEHVVDEVADFSDDQVSEIKDQVFPAFAFWLESR